MKKIFLLVAFAAMTITASAQNSFELRFLGTYPDIIDFAWNFVTINDDDPEGEADESMNAVKQALEKYRTGVDLDENDILTVDKKNGFLVYESRYDQHLLRVEMCYWNEADKKHKLFVCSTWCYENGKPSLGQFDGMCFLRYNNATKKMTFCDAPGFEVSYDNTTYSLPRTGKDITVTKWNADGTKTEKTLKWNGHGFSK